MDISSVLYSGLDAFRKFSRDELESVFEVLSKRIINGETLAFDENIFMQNYVNLYYVKKSFGDNSHEEKTKNIYRDLFEYYIKTGNIDKGITVPFITMFTGSEMALEKGIDFDLIMDDSSDDRFKLTSKGNLTTFGFHKRAANKSHVYINPHLLTQIEEGKYPNYKILETVFHELEHGVQMMHIENEDLTNPQAINWAKEYIVWSLFPGKKKDSDDDKENYYDDNYSDIFFERDARLYARERVIKLYSKLNPNQSLRLAGLNSNYDLDVLHRDPEDYAKRKIAIDLTDVIVSKFILKNPSFYLKKFPVLNNVYRSDGTKKTYVEILSDFMIKAQSEIAASPEKEDEILDKYLRLVHEISRTDNELYIQRLCYETYEKFNSVSEQEKNESMESITSVFKKRVLEYEEEVPRLDAEIRKINQERMKLLHNGVHTKENSDRIDYLQSLITKYKMMKEALLTFIPSFKERYEIIKEQKNMKDSLESILGKELTMYEGFFDKGFIRMEYKPYDKLRKEYYVLLRELTEKNTDPRLISYYKDMFKKYLDTVYEFERPQREEEARRRREEYLNKLEREECIKTISKIANMDISKYNYYASTKHLYQVSKPLSQLEEEKKQLIDILKANNMDVKYFRFVNQEYDSYIKEAKDIEKFITTHTSVNELTMYTWTISNDHIYRNDKSIDELLNEEKTIIEELKQMGAEPIYIEYVKETYKRFIDKVRKFNEENRRKHEENVRNRKEIEKILGREIDFDTWTYHEDGMHVDRKSEEQLRRELDATIETLKSKNVDQSVIDKLIEIYNEYFDIKSSYDKLNK